MNTVTNVKGEKYHKTYQVWANMKDRCLNGNNHFYDRYGGRGIEICDRWKTSFGNFVNDMGIKPDDKSIDRIDNDKGYEPFNCRWATTKEQGFNRGNSRGYTFHKWHGKYHVNIKVNGDKFYFGSYDNPEEAREVYLREKAKIHKTDIRPEVVKNLHNVWDRRI